MKSIGVVAALGTLAGLGLLVAQANAQNAQHMPIIVDDDRRRDPKKPDPKKPDPKPSKNPIFHGGDTVSLEPGGQYRAIIRLHGVEALATNDQVEARIQETIGPWKAASVSQDGEMRIALGIYDGAARSIVLPSEVDTFQRLDTPKKNDPKKPDAPKTDNTPSGFARRLRSYLDKTHSFGSKSKPDSNVKKAQAGMAGGLVADGIVGPKTRTRAKALGVTLPAKPVLESHPVTVKTGDAVIKPHALPLPPPNPPAPTDPAKDNTPKGWATRLRVYLENTHSFGSKARPNANVGKAQKGMAGGLVADGIVGPKTRARAKALGVTLPAAPAPKPAAAPAPKPTPKPPAPAPKPAPKPAPAPAPKPAPKPAAQPTGPKKRTATQAADQLYAYVTERVRGNRVAELGTKTHPIEFIRSAQADMGKLVADGIYGPKTQARGKELTGKPWPTRPAPAAPATRSAVDAANALLSYLTKGGLQGTRASPAPTVRDAQRDMGGGLVADGIYGPKTQARGRVLTGKAFPNRT